MKLTPIKKSALAHLARMERANPLSLAVKMKWRSYSERRIRLALKALDRAGLIRWAPDHSHFTLTDSGAGVVKRFKSDWSNVTI